MLCSFLFFSSPFSLCCLDWVNSIVLPFSSLTLPFVPSILLLNPPLSFIFSYCIFQFSNSIWFFVISYMSLLRLSIFFICFKYICNFPLKYFFFNDGCFKSLLDCAHYFHDLSVGSIACIFSFSLSSSWILVRTVIFHLNPGHFWLLHNEALGLRSTFCFHWFLLTLL